MEPSWSEGGTDYYGLLESPLLLSWRPGCGIGSTLLDQYNGESSRHAIAYRAAVSGGCRVHRRNALGRRQRPERHRRRQPEQHQLRSARQRLLRAAGRAAPELLPHDRLDRRRGPVEPERLRDLPPQSPAGHARQPRADQPGGVCAPVHGHPLPRRRQRQLQQHHLGPVLWLQDQHRAAAAPECLPASCSLPDASSNSYAFSELPFPEAPPEHRRHQLLSGHDAHRQQPRRSATSS